MEHPFKEQRDAQVNMLAEAPEKQREFLRLMFSIGNAAYIYHTQTRTEVIPTEEDFKDWLIGLPKGMRIEMEKEGFEKCKTMFPFTRHVMERHDVGMEEWMRQNLTEQEYEFWKSQQQG